MIVNSARNARHQPVKSWGTSTECDTDCCLPLVRINTRPKGKSLSATGVVNVETLQQHSVYQQVATGTHTTLERVEVVEKAHLECLRSSGEDVHCDAGWTVDKCQLQACCHLEPRRWFFDTGCFWCGDFSTLHTKYRGAVWGLWRSMECVRACVIG